MTAYVSPVVEEHDGEMDVVKAFAPYNLPRVVSRGIGVDWQRMLVSRL